MDDEKLLRAMYFPVRLFLSLVPLTIILILINRMVPVLSVVRFELFMFASAFLLFFVDLFLQTFLYQKTLWRLIYILLLGFLVVLLYFSFDGGYRAIYPEIICKPDGFCVLGTSGIISIIIQMILISYWFYLNIKKFFVEVWEVDLK